MKLRKLVNRLQKLHPKEIDLSLNRVKELCKKLGNPQDKIKAISVVGTNGKYSTIQALYAILKEANLKCNIYTSPHIKKINERFVFNNQELNDDELANLFEEIEEVNKNQPITFFEILTTAYFYKAAKYPDNINLIETGLFHRFDATNILKNNLASIVTSIGLDHLDWLSENEKTIEKIIFEKTSTLLTSNIIVAKQTSTEITENIKKTISKNNSNKFFHNENYSFSVKENNVFFYEDQLGDIKLPMPNVNGLFQLENISTAIATARIIKNFDIKDKHILQGITKIDCIARLQELKSGKLKDLVKMKHVEWNWIKGHSDDPLNDLVDRLHPRRGSDDVETSTMGFGANGFVGVEYFFAPKMGLSAEYSHGLMYSSEDDGSDDRSEFDISGGTTSINLNFYF